MQSSPDKIKKPLPSIAPELEGLIDFIAHLLAEEYMKENNILGKGEDCVPK